MYIIKRYSNRKLYDTVRKRYLTLNEVGELVAQGEDVKVVDNETGADLTNQTLTQVIYEQEKKHQGFLPKNLLSNLIQKGGSFLDRLPQSLHSFLHPQEQNLDDLMEIWIAEGLLAKEAVERVREDLLFLYGDQKLKTLLEEVLSDFDLPSRGELRKLQNLLLEVENELEERT